MAKGSAWKYVVASVVILSLTVHIVCFWVIYVPSAFSRRFKRPACAWTKPQMKRSRQNETPPWISLLADYNATIRSGRNLYLHARGCRQYRLGNILFNYAAVFGIAWHNHRIPIWQKNRNQDITNFFNLRVPTDEENFITRSRFTQWLNVYAHGSGIYDRKFEHLPRRNVTIVSVFASYKYFSHVEDQLRIELTLKSHILETARRWLEQHSPTAWRGTNFVRVVIHVRRKDYTKAYYARDGWPIPTVGYFNRSMSYFTDCLERVQFVVLSDDPAWCREHINATNIAYSTEHSPIVDLAIASLCDHAIITIGTFGWWAAWFANGITITQRNLPKKGSALSRRLHREDHYKREWIGL